MIDPNTYSLFAVCLLGLGTVLATSEVGWRLGIRAEGRGGNNISALEQSFLGLLALMIGFTFAMALTRFEGRREAVLNEANAIGTTALRARLLPEPYRTETLKLLREYAQIRVDYLPSGKSFAELPPVVDRSNKIQASLWQQARAAMLKDNSMVPGGLFIQSLNEMIDNPSKASFSSVQQYSKYRAAFAARHNRCRVRICQLRQWDRPATVTAASTHSRSLDLCSYISDSGSRPAKRGVRHHKPAADHGYTLQYRWIS
jgi:hypothetical protein